MLIPHNHGQNIEKIVGHMPTIEEFQITAEMFQQLSDSNRLRIFWILCHCEECVVNLSAIVGMSSPAVSHHLKLLRSNGLIVSHRKGKEVYYKATDNDKALLLHNILEKLISISCPIYPQQKESNE